MIDKHYGKTYLTIMSSETKLSVKGQVVIPKDVRDALHWEVGVPLSVTRTGDAVILRPTRAKRKRISYAEFRRQVPKYEGPPVSIDNMNDKIGELFKDWKS